MPVEGQERAVTVVIGAVLMFGLLVSALALYQVNVVPNQNEQTEWDHHQEVTGDLLDLRNEIVNAGYGQSSRETSISLGTQYESRTFSINPPDPRGTVRTNATDEPVVVETAGDTYRFDTSFVEYEPGYHEYDAPKTVIEHGLVYAAHGDRDVVVDAGGVVSNDRVVVPLIQGDLSESSLSSGSVTVETVDVYHASNAVESIKLPTNSVEAWERAYATNTSGDRVELRDLAGKDVYVAQVVVGDGESNETISDRVAEFGEPVDGQPNPFDLAWQERSKSGAPGDELTLTASVAATIEGANARFAADDGDDIIENDVDAQSGPFEDGTASVEIDIADSATRGDTAEVYVSSGGVTKTATISVAAGRPDYSVSIDSTSETVPPNTPVEVEYTIRNDGTERGEQDIELLVDDSTEAIEPDVALEAGESYSGSFTFESGDGGSEMNVTVRSDDDYDTETVTVEERPGLPGFTSGAVLVAILLVTLVERRRRSADP